MIRLYDEGVKMSKDRLFDSIKICMSNIRNDIKVQLIKKLYENDDEYIKVFFDNNQQSVNDDDVLLEIEKISKNNIHITTIEDDNYPNNLKNINQPPCLLFYKGNIDILNGKNKNVAIIGSRDCTDYGKKASQIIVSKLCDGDVTIISGGARGIDSIANEYAVRSSSSTVCVFGNGLNISYPKSNHELFKKVEETGCLISEFLPDTPPMKYNFPMRNRIISGLSDYLIVVEGGEKSGTSITASFAADQGRTVYAVPGSIFSDKSRGPNKLISEGAIPIYSFNGLLDEMNIKPKKQKKFHSNVIKDRILQILDEGPQDINYIIEHTDVDTSSLYDILYELQFEKEIVILNGNFYAKIE